jgi:DNA-binding IclR family transcriptional regulator
MHIVRVSMATKTLQSLERGLDLLFLFSAERPTLSLPEIAKALDLPGSTAYRLVTTCCRKNVLIRDSRAKRYELHASLLRFQHVLRSRLDIRRIALPHLDELAALSGETSQLFLLQGNDVVCAEAVSSPNMIRFMPERGRAIPLHASALGRAVLAFLPESFLTRYIEEVGLPAMTPHTITNPKMLRALLLRIRKQRYALTFQQMYLGARGVAVPVFGREGTAIASLGISGPHPRFTDRNARGLVLALRTHSMAISETMRELGEQSNEALTPSGRRVRHGGTDWRPRP